MGFFSWFKSDAPRYGDCVWMNEAARQAAIARTVAESQRPVLLVAFFEASLAAVSGLRAERILAERIQPAFAPASDGPEICVVEHHPLPAQNEKLLQKLLGLSPHKPTFHVALDEPLLKLFGGDRVVALMQQLGMKPDEMVSHPMVSKALENARIKIAKKVRLEQPASSMAEWFSRNVSA
jgi:hypothetical protein